MMANTNPALVLPGGTKLQNGTYTIGKVLGQGGFGITYYGGDMNLHRSVAIKEFFPDGSIRRDNSVQPGSAMSPADFQEAKKKFLEEARALARFHHRNIVQILTIFEESSTAYMVMEFLKGKTLMLLLQERGVLPESEAIRYMEEIGEALTAVHGAGLIHRDIKPENVMVCEDGRVVLIDFGLNKKLEQLGSHATRPLSATTHLGSEGYAPPEQHLAHGIAGAFTDVYALGATLYHLLTGQVPVSAPQRAMGSDLMPPDRVNPNVGHAASQAVMRAMALKSDERPQSVREFLDLLRGNVASRVTPPPLPSILPPPLPSHAPTLPLYSQPGLPTVAQTRSAASVSCLSTISVILLCILGLVTTVEIFGEWAPSFIFLGTNIWVAFDAKAIGVRKGLLSGWADMSYAGWIFACLFLWIIAFPAYIMARIRIKELHL